MRKLKRKRGSAILLVTLLLATISIYLGTILSAAGFMLESSKRRALDLKKLYAAEGLARLGIEHARANPSQKQALVSAEGGQVVISKGPKTVTIQAEFEGKKVVAILEPKNLSLMSWRPF